MSYPVAGFTDETAFNKWLRSRIRGRGYQCIHVREADAPGPLDLVVWQGGRLVGWFELKLDDREVETSQKEFMRQCNREGVRNYVIRFRRDVEIFDVQTYEPPHRGFVTRLSTDQDLKLLDFILQ